MRKFFFLLFLTCSLAAEENFQPKKLELSEKEIKTDWGKRNPCGKDIPLSLRQAMQFTLEYQQKVKISIEQVNHQAGVVQEYGAPFDWLSEFDLQLIKVQNAASIYVSTREPGDNNTATISESKKFRIGTEVSVKGEIQQVHDPSLVQPPITPATASYPLYNMSSITFHINQPFLKGFLYGVEAMRERASVWNLKSVYYDSLFSISQDVLETVNRYWDVVAAQQELKVRKASVESFELLVRKTKRLVDENQLAPSEINQPLANLASERVSYFTAQQVLYSAMQNLKLAIGIVPTVCISKDLIDAVDDFPELLSEGDLCSLMDAFVQYGIKYRLDLKASLMRENEFRTLLTGSRNELLPRLDVFGEYNITYYSRGRESREFFSSLDYQYPERNYTVGLVLSRPLCNDEAKGHYRQNMADLRRTTYETIELKQTIMTNVMNAWMNHFRFLKEIGDAKKATEYFGKLVDDEGKRLVAGVGSLFNLIDYQNRLTDSQARLINIRHDYAQNLARLHFETGLLLEPDSKLCSFAVQNVMHLPVAHD